jgi:NADH-quinone oxidoreductase subunit N
VGVVISLYYYFGVIRTVYWGQETANREPIAISVPMRLAMVSCIAGMFFIGIFPGPVLKLASEAVKSLK